jgi:putative sporulation protein YtaF
MYEIRGGMSYMNSIFFSIAIAIAANLDNLGVGIAYGIQKIRISHMANLIIALISFIATWLSAETGKVISLYLSPQIANVIGAFLLFSVGVWVFVQPILTAIKSNHPILDLQLFGERFYIGPTEILSYPERADIDNSRSVGNWEAVILGIALSINALAGGFDAGAVGISSLVEATLVGTFSFVTIIAGYYFGRKYAAEQIGKYATVISGTLLMAIGVHQLLG